MKLQEIKDLRPCIDGWENLIKHYPKLEWFLIRIYGTKVNF